MKKLTTLLLVMVAITSSTLQAETDKKADGVSTIEAFSVMPVIRSVAVSKDGKKLAIVRATTKNGDYIIEIRDPFNLQKKPVRLGADKMKVSGVSWLNDNKIGVMFRQVLEDRGRKYWVNKFAITDADGKGKWIIPFSKKRNVSFSIIDTLPKNKDEVLVEVDINNNYIPDVVRLNINTGRSVTVFRGNNKVSGGFMVDHDGDVRVAQGWNLAKNTLDLFGRVKGDDDWKLIYRNSPDNRESFTVLGFSKDEANKLYVNANKGGNTTGVYLYDLKTGEYSERLFGLKNVDTDGILLDKDKRLKGFSYTSKHPKNYFIDPNEEVFENSLKKAFPNKQVNILSRSKDDSVLVLYTASGNDTGSYYILTNKKKVDKIGERLPLVDKTKLSEVKYVSYKARDGRKIRAYITKPKGKGPFPAIVLPHGGPWVRDTIVFDDWSQLLASHGYIVIQPNYRGSTGYGLEHWIAGDRNWGLKMQDDLDDAALYLVNKGLATKDKLAMFGWSYGGYAAFAASMRDNNIYQCTVAGAGVSDLSRINAKLNDSPFLSRLQRPTITGVSPVKQVEKVNVPILVIHGDMDQRVPIVHSEAFVSELKKHEKDYKYVVLEDADHFSDTLFYNHKKLFYTELINWLDNKCGLKK